MARLEYDEETSRATRVDIAHEIEDSPTPAARWVDAMRRLNTIDDPLGRKLMKLHRDCGSGTGICDSLDDVAEPIAGRSSWGCETIELVAGHFGVTYPSNPSTGDP